MSTISASHQILMTARGKQVKVQNIPTEQEIFLYDRRVLASVTPAKATALLPKDHPPDSFYPDKSPDNAASYDTLQAWQTSFKSRRTWAIGLTEGSRRVVDGVGKANEHVDIITRGVAIAVDNIKQHVASLRSKYNESKAWADQICDDQAFLLGNWQRALEVLQSIQADEKLGHCLHGVDVIPTKSRSGTIEITLLDFVDSADVKAAATSGEAILRHFSDRVEDLSYAFETASSSSSTIVDQFEHDKQIWVNDARDQADRLMEEIEVLTRKISADYEHVLGLPDTPKSISQAAKIAQLHKGNFLPSLIQANEEINQLLAQVLERKEQVMDASIKYLQGISVVESNVSAAHTKLAKLDIDESSGQIFDMLNFVIRLPITYGSLLVECVRRQEWADKMTTDSSSLVEEIATYKEDEVKRRKRWIKDMEGAINLQFLDDMAFGIEVNVQSQRQKWPKVTRNDVSDFLYRLNQVGDLDGAVKVIEDLVNTLDAPSKQQARRAKAFKNGSVHEAAYGKTSLLLRGDDEVLLNMRNEKSKAEDKLKSAESRIRKLEDLLHRQSQVGAFSRPTSANDLAVNAPTFERYATSPVPNFSSALSKARETGSRRSSVSSRRISMNIEPEEKSLAQRIVGLEADLTKEKAKSADMAKKAAARSNAEDLLKSQVREATSTKEDLLGNLEAQQREFDDERRLLHDEKAALTLKIEELEDEFDRVLGSREHEDKTRALEEELEQVRMTTISEMERAQRQLEMLQDSHTKQRAQIETLEGEVQQRNANYIDLDRKTNQLIHQQEGQDQLHKNHQKSLRTTLSHLSADDAPEDFGALVEKLQSIAERSTTHLNDIQSALASVRNDNQALETRFQDQSEKVYSLRERLGDEERKVLSLREEFDKLQKEGTDLQTQLESERGDSAQLRNLLAQTETDLKALRKETTEKEVTIANMSGTISRHETERRDLNSKLSEHTTSLKAMRSKYEDLESTRNAHVTRSIMVSERVVSQNAALERLLEHIGLTVTKEDGTMVIQKAPRASSASTSLMDPSASMKRSLSGPMPAKNDLEISMEPSVLRWAEAEDVEELESRFDAFTKVIDIFDIQRFNEGVYKRVKEIENIARKWQKEARAYRDKSHRAQGDAHDRIALRNFKEGDLALFLPTRDQATKPWAAFNVGAPHCFLREQDSHNLGKRDWLIARISKVEERVVDLSKSINGGLKGSGDQKSGGDKSDIGVFPNDENPYELSDGLRWYLIDAAEEKPGAPINIGTGKVTVASTNVDAKGSMRMKKTYDGNAATKTLTRSLDSRRSSTNSKKGLVAVASNTTNGPNELEGMLEQSIDNAAATAAATSNLQRETDGQDALQTDEPHSSQHQDVGGPGHEHVGKTGASDS